MTPEPLPLVRIEAGMSIETALDAFRAGCNYPPDRFWITDTRIALRFDQLRKLLSDPIIEAEAEALTKTVLKKRYLDDVIQRLADHKSDSWEEFCELRSCRATKAWKAARERGFFPWQDVDACRVSPFPMIAGGVGVVASGRRRRGSNAPVCAKSRPLLNARHDAGSVDVGPLHKSRVDVGATVRAGGVADGPATGAISRSIFSWKR